MGGAWVATDAEGGLDYWGEENTKGEREKKLGKRVGMIGF